MINVFLADDENFVRIGIKSVVNWEENGYKIVGEAGDGKEAIEKILRLKPDVTFLDITMPLADGITVLKEIRAKGYEGYVVMLTCHSDFEFAQQAIKFQANDYILKNDISGEKLLDYLNNIDKKYHFQKNKDNHDKAIQIKENKINFFLNVMRIGFMDELDLDKIFERYKLKISKRDIYMLSVKIKEYDKVIGRYEKNGYEILSSSMENIFDKAMEKYHEYEVIKYSQDLYIILITFKNNRSELQINSNINNIVEELTYATKTFLNVTIEIAIKYNEKGLEQIHKSFEENKVLLEQTYFNPKKNIFYSNEKFNADENDVLLYKLKNDLNKALDIKANFKISEVVNEWINITKKDNIIIKKDKFNYIMGDFLEKLSIVQNSTINTNIDSFQNINELLEELKQIDLLLKQNRSKPHNYLVAQVLEIIDESFTSNISLDDIATTIGVTSSYISRLFSKSMDRTISNYIIEKRLEYAKNLIRTTNLKHYQIAEKCGFNSSIHFTNMFKKHCGTTPNEFRNKSAK